MAQKIQLTYVFDTEDELREHLAGETRAATPTPTPTPTPEEKADEPTVTDVDADGMPYDADIHSSPPSFTDNGNWRNKRGKAAEANAARAAFKAAGGATDTTEPETAVMPGMPTAAPAPETNDPVTYDDMWKKTMSMIEREVIDANAVSALYVKIGLKDSSELETNETMRAALMAELNAIEA